MDGKIGIVIGFVAGAVIGAGAMFAAYKPAIEQQVAAEPEKIVVTQVVERAIMVAKNDQPAPVAPATEAARPDDQTIAFKPADAPAGVISTNDTRHHRTPEEWRAEWTNREARFRAEWTNNAVVARTNFIAKASLSGDQAVRFDVLMTAMNLKLASVLDPIIAQTKPGEWPHLTSEDRARVSHEVSGAVVNTYDEMNRAMPSDWNNVAQSNNVSLTQFVDPNYLPFMHGMGVGGGPGGGRGGPGGGGPGGGRGGRGGGG